MMTKNASYQQAKTWDEMRASLSQWEGAAAVCDRAETMGLSADDVTFVGHPVGGFKGQIQLIFGDWREGGDWTIVTAEGVCGPEPRTGKPLTIPTT